MILASTTATPTSYSLIYSLTHILTYLLTYLLTYGQTDSKVKYITCPIPIIWALARFEPLPFFPIHCLPFLFPFPFPFLFHLNTNILYTPSFPLSLFPSSSPTIHPIAIYNPFHPHPHPLHLQSPSHRFSYSYPHRCYFHCLRSALTLGAHGPADPVHHALTGSPAFCCHPIRITSQLLNVALVPKLPQGTTPWRSYLYLPAVLPSFTPLSQTRKVLPPRSMADFPKPCSWTYHPTCSGIS